MDLFSQRIRMHPGDFDRFAQQYVNTKTHLQDINVGKKALPTLHLLAINETGTPPQDARSIT
jgi:hypothetical protein